MMVAKQCPKCHENIPVACKTCPCGHQFAKSLGKDGRQQQQQQEQALQRRIDRPRRLQQTASNLYYDVVALYARRKPVVKRHGGGSANKSDAATAAAAPLRRKGFLKVSSAGGKNKRSAVSEHRRKAAAGGETVKRKRGRPKGPAGSLKGGSGRSAHLLNRVARPKTGDQHGPDGKDGASMGKDKDAREAEEDGHDRYGNLPSDKVLQYSIVLQEINRKLLRVGGFKV